MRVGMEDQLNNSTLRYPSSKQSLQGSNGFRAGIDDRCTFPKHAKGTVLIEIDLQLRIIGQEIQEG
jgi:hypothetical protein